MTPGEWDDACNAKEARQLGFDDAMKRFVQIQVDTDCCQMYGICGEQYIGDVIFNSRGQVVTTRFRFQHTALSNQKSFIDALVDSRQVVDSFKGQLKTIDLIDENDVEELEAAVFSYSLFYVFYDQYTYITGIMAMDTLLALAAVILAIEIITNLGIALFVALCVFLVAFNLLGALWLTNIIFGGF